MLSALIGKGWKFSERSIDGLSDSQLEVINISINVGNTQGLGVVLAALSIVETQAGAYMGNTRNRICGVHQIDVINLKDKLKSNGDWRGLCEQINANVHFSATMALRELTYWLDNSKSLRQAINRYNRGWLPHKHDVVFWGRFQQAYITINNAIVEDKLQFRR